jgi:hypothetical protein
MLSLPSSLSSSQLALAKTESAVFIRAPKKEKAVPQNFKTEERMCRLRTIRFNQPIKTSRTVRVHIRKFASLRGTKQVLTKPSKIKYRSSHTNQPHQSTN